MRCSCRALFGGSGEISPPLATARIRIFKQPGEPQNIREAIRTRKISLGLLEIRARHADAKIALGLTRPNALLAEQKRKPEKYCWTYLVRLVVISAVLPNAGGPRLETGRQIPSEDRRD